MTVQAAPAHAAGEPTVPEPAARRPAPVAAISGPPEHRAVDLLLWLSETAASCSAGQLADATAERLSEDLDVDVHLVLLEPAARPDGPPIWWQAAVVARHGATEPAAAVAGAALALAKGSPECSPECPPECSPECADDVLAFPMPSIGCLVLAGPIVGQLPSLWRRVAAEVARVLATVISEARSRRDREQQTAVATALQRLLQCGVTAGSPLEAAQALTETLAVALRARAACALLTERDGVVRAVAAHGCTPEQEAQLVERMVGTSILQSPAGRQVALRTSDEPVLISSTDQEGTVRAGGLAHTLGLRSLAVIPLLSSDGALGVVAAGDFVPRAWTDEERQLLVQLARQGAVVVDNARLRAAERALAATDPLSGLPNRRAFYERLDADVDNARQGGRLALLHLDLDGFKAVNDRHGHAAGDALLVAVAGRLQARLRPGASVARLGGDEFAVLLTGHDDPSAPLYVASRLREAIAAPLCLPALLGDVDVTINVSIGIAVHQGDGETGDGLLARADAAMYRAKASGSGFQLASR